MTSRRIWIDNYAFTMLRLTGLDWRIGIELGELAYNELEGSGEPIPSPEDAARDEAEKQAAGEISPIVTN